MNKTVKKKAGIALFLAAALLLAIGIGRHLSGKAPEAVASEAASPEAVPSEAAVIELFVLSPCESCREAEKFREEIDAQLAAENAADKTCIGYNVFREEDRLHFEEVVAKNGLDLTVQDLPLAIADGKVYRGSYQEIAASVTQSASGQPDIFADIRRGKEADTTLVLFVTSACESCMSVEAYLDDALPKAAARAGQAAAGQAVTEAGQAAEPRVRVLRYNITEGENAPLLQRFMKVYDVEREAQQVPILFTREGYLSGASSIQKKLSEQLEGGTLAGSWEARLTELEQPAQENAGMKVPVWQMLGAGILNGLNPCGMSMLLMVLSVILLSGRNFYKGSLVFLGGKYVAYLCIGLGIGALAGVIQSAAFLAVQEVLKTMFALLALGLGIFYFLDFVYVMRQEYGKERLQLPAAFRKWNHAMIQKLAKVPGHFWYPMLLVLGVAISAGEFLCTGQVYLASLLYMLQQGGGLDGKLAGYLMLYLAAMCLPLLALIVLAHRAQSIMAASRLSRKLLPVVKIVYSIFFFVLFCIL